MPHIRTVFIALLAEAAIACGGSSVRTTAITCENEPRPQLDCQSEFSYDGHAVEGGFSAMGIAELQGNSELKALRALDVETERYVAQARRLCDEYNKCVLDRETYATRSENLRRRMSKVPALYDNVKSAASDGARRQALANAYDELVGATPLTMTFTVKASAPSERTLRPIQEGASLRTGDRVAFELRVSEASHVYLFQRTEEKSIRVLFPDPRIPIRNPIDAAIRIPDGDRTFYLDDNDIGTERVFLVASRVPIPSLERAIESLGSGNAPTPMLATLTRVKPQEDDCRSRALVLEENSGAVPDCVRARGLTLDPSAGAEPVSYALRTEAADDRVAGVFSFQHLP